MIWITRGLTIGIQSPFLQVNSSSLHRPEVVEEVELEGVEDEELLGLQPIE